MKLVYEPRIMGALSFTIAMVNSIDFQIGLYWSGSSIGLVSLPKAPLVKNLYCVVAMVGDLKIVNWITTCNLQESATAIVSAISLAII